MRLTIVGADGKMGRELIKAILEDQEITLAGAVAHKDSPYLDKDVGTMLSREELGIIITNDAMSAFQKSDAVIDFTRPEASLAYVSCAADCGIAHIIGTTGFNKEEEIFLEKFSHKIPIVKSGNMSLGVNLLAALVKRAAASLNAKDFDIEITEMHHRYKVDSPSGTALLLGKVAAEGRGEDLQKIASFEHKLGEARQTGTIGFSVARGGTVIGDHSVIFAGENERVVLSHFAQDRSIFALGALKAAFWAIKQKPGFYTMADVLNL